MQTIHCVILPEWRDASVPGAWNCPEACYTSEEKANAHCQRLIDEDIENGDSEEAGYQKPYVTPLYVE